MFDFSFKRWHIPRIVPLLFGLIVTLSVCAFLLYLTVLWEMTSAGPFAPGFYELAFLLFIFPISLLLLIFLSRLMFEAIFSLFGIYLEIGEFKKGKRKNPERR